MTLPDLTARTDMGAVDLVPFLRRDRGVIGVVLLDWEREPAVLALHQRGWSPERIGHATGLNSADVRAMLAGRAKRRYRPKTHCKNLHRFTEANTSWAQGRRECLQCRRDRDRARRAEARTA